MKWIFISILFLSFNCFSIESTPAKSNSVPNPTQKSSCSFVFSTAPGGASYTPDECKQYWVNKYGSSTVTYTGNWFSVSGGFKLMTLKGDYIITSASSYTQYSCPPDGKPNFTSGPIDLNGSKVCQTTPKTCLMGAAVRIDKDGKETCVANCSAAAGLSNGGAVYYNGGADNTISSDDVTCFGQCAVSATTLVQNAAGYYSGPFTFTGANCSVIRPEPVTGSDTAGLNETPVPVDNSNTSQGTQDSLDDLSNAASSSSSTEIDTPSTGANGESTIKDLQQTVKDSAIEQIKSNTSSASNLGNLLSNISNDLQNAIANSGAGGGNGNSSLQLQGNNKLDGINQTLQDISDKLDEPQEEEPPFTPPTSSPNFWENVLPDSSFNDIKSKTESAGQELKDMYEDFRSSIFVSDIAASGTAWSDSFTKNGQTFELGSSWFEYAINHGFYAIVILLATMFAVYIVTSRGK
ncbi:hypothetical protein [Aeromonas caviae]|uniref:hypothetical protein n=1 Tax=Aeromonas caviae TaxID=648 RepID=UPI002B46EFCF|nr:hypothetical protein [Aeromonas caviae]